MTSAEWLLLVGGIGVAAWWPIRRLGRRVDQERAAELYRLQREQLAERLATLIGRPGLSFVGPPRLFAEISGVGLVALQRLIDPGSGDAERAALVPTVVEWAVFRYASGQWGTEGRLLKTAASADCPVDFPGWTALGERWTERQP